MLAKPCLNVIGVIIALSFIILLNGCTKHLALTYRSTAYTDCPLRVSDNRPDPDFLYAHATEGIARILMTPSLAIAVSKSICSRLQNSASMRSVKFVITDFECVVTGFFELRYVADLRGSFEMEGNAPHEIRVSNVLVTSNGYIPKGCEAASAPLIDMLSDEIASTLAQHPMHEIDKGVPQSERALH